MLEKKLENQLLKSSFKSTFEILYNKHYSLSSCLLSLVNDELLELSAQGKASYESL